MAKFKTLPNSGHMIVVPSAGRGQPATRHSIYADADGIIETDDEHEIAQLRQGGVCEEILVKKAVVEPEPAEKETVEELPKRVRKRATKAGADEEETASAPEAGEG